VAYLAAHIKRMRAGNPLTAVVSAGDLTGASPLLSSLFKDEPTVQAMNLLGLDYEGVGNHDFDHGLAELLRLQHGGCALGDCSTGDRFEGATFKYLAANVDNVEAQQTVFPPYAMHSFGDVKVAFIGMTLENTPGSSTEIAMRGLRFHSEVETANALVPQLRREGASAIVVLLHEGGKQGDGATYDSCKDLSGDLMPLLKGDTARNRPPLSPEIEVVVSAHTHQAYNCTIDGRLVTSAASAARVITQIELSIDPDRKTILSKRAKNVPVTHDIEEDSDVKSLVAAYQTKAAPRANRVIGTIAGDLLRTNSAACEMPLGDVIADSQLEATRAQGAVIALMNPFGIRADLFAHGPNKTDGAVTYADAFAVQPFGNYLVTLSLTGAQLQKALEQQFTMSTPRIMQVSSSLSYNYTYDAPTGRGVIDASSIRIAGEALRPDASYRVTANNFLAGGGDGIAVMKEGTDRVNGAVDLDALEQYFQSNSAADRPLAIPSANRIGGSACP
jgi:5'-nucleotidase